MPNRRIDYFVGREDILSRIDEAFSAASSSRIAVLRAMGGQGKSQIALEYCHRKRNNPFSAIFWIDAATESAVIGSFQSIFEEIKSPTDNCTDDATRVAYVLRKIASWSSDWLLIFDNYDNPSDFPHAQSYFPEGRHGNILVTSRHAETKELVATQNANFIELPGLDEDAALTLLVQRNETDGSNLEHAKDIVQRLGYHPLAITQAGAYIRKRKLDLSQFMHHYSQRKDIILKNTPHISQYTKKLPGADRETALSVFTTYELSFTQLQSQPSQGDTEAKILTLLAFFDNKDIPESLFSGWSKSESRVIRELCAWFEVLASDHKQWDTDLFEDRLLTLRDLSLVQTYIREADGLCHISLHPLVKDWIRLRTDRSVCQGNALIAADLVRNILEKNSENKYSDLSFSSKQNLLSHVKAQQQNQKDYLAVQFLQRLAQDIYSDYYYAMHWNASFLMHMGLLDSAATLQEQHKIQCENIFGPEHPITLQTTLALAWTFKEQSRLKEAEQLATQVLEISKRTSNMKNANAVLANVILSTLFSTQRRWREVERTLQELEIAKGEFGAAYYTPSIVTAIQAKTYCNQEQWKEAEELQMEILETRKEKDSGMTDPSTLEELNRLAGIYYFQGRWEKAEKLQTDVLETRKNIMGLKHPATFLGMEALALTSFAQGNKRGALELMTEVFQLCTERLGAEHPDTKRSKEILDSWSTGTV